MLALGGYEYREPMRALGSPRTPDGPGRAAILAVGVDHDVLRTTRARGEEMLRRLGPGNGSVIEDRVTGMFYWLLRVGSGSELPAELLGCDVQLLASTWYISVPSAAGDGRRRWRGSGAEVLPAVVLGLALTGGPPAVPAPGRRLMP
ncbi:hypothetical protein [Kitasatospora sp. NPDC057015]|uniref:hypothetical protein n=1 Tax=Kitasatospora sp. NPDC057015 TaxID=3346001 RepID=UPI00362C11E3